MDWNDERISALKKMWQDGLSASQVARHLGGVSRSAVIGKVHRLGIAGRDLPSGPRGVAARQSARGSVRGALAAPRRATPLRGERASPGPRVVFEVAPTADINTLSVHGCRWPIGDPDEAGFGYCGRLRAGRRSYCVGHAQMAFRRIDHVALSQEVDHLLRRFNGEVPHPAAL